jgi:hypothetical protein
MWIRYLHSTTSQSVQDLILSSALSSDQGGDRPITLRPCYESPYQDGGKRYSYDTVTHDVRGESAWREHHGNVAWHQICQNKRELTFWAVVSGIWDGK